MFKFEHAAFCVSGTPGRIRTCDPMIRSHVLYPAELLVRNEGLYIPHLARMGKWILHDIDLLRSIGNMFACGSLRKNLVPLKLLKK